MQVVEDIKPSYPLFRDDQYKGMLANKQQQFEGHAIGGTRAGARGRR